MVVLKVSLIFLLALFVRADKKIELQDIEEDNLKSEKENEYENSEPRSQSSASGSSLVPLDYLKNGFLRYFEPNPTPQARYVQQYDVTEQPESPPPVGTPKVQYGLPATQTQQAMVGYLSNVPMQINLVPQYYNDAQEHAANSQTGVHYSTAGANRVSSYQNSPEGVQTKTNYIEIRPYVTPTANTYVSHYFSPVELVSYSPQPTVAPPQPTIAPVLAYQPVQYQTTLVQNPSAVPSKEYYQNAQYTETNGAEEVGERDDENPTIHTEVTYQKAPIQEYHHRYYPAQTPLREDYIRHSTVSELPHPHSLLLKSPRPHSLSHIPKALPIYRPLTKPVYATGGGLSFTQKPPVAYGPPFKRRPTSLLDSYIPSHIQVEYMKRGYANDPIEAYEALSSGRHLINSPDPRHYERGFLPNQMYPTASGGVSYAHYKRTPKVEKSQHN